MGYDLRMHMKRSGIGTEINPNSDSEPTKSKGKLKIDYIFFVGGITSKAEYLSNDGNCCECDLHVHLLFYKHQLGNVCAQK